MTESDFNQQLLNFLNKSPSPFHAVSSMLEAFQQAGYQRLNERDAWDLKQGQSYVVTRNGSSIVAFTLPVDPVATGFRMLGAHTDSPCLKVKTNPDLNDQGYLRLGVETYGGVLLSTWFDRDLSVAGRVAYRSTEGSVKQTLINFDRAIGSIPNLAIHLNREVNKGVAINAQTDLPVLLMHQSAEESVCFDQLLMEQLNTQGVQDAEQILEHECFLYDTQSAALTGFRQEFIASARLDNLLSCYIGMQTMLNTEQKVPALLVCNDHEEVGSMSASGAQGPFLQSVLKRIARTEERYQQMLAASMMISCDNAHGIHPNYAKYHDNNHAPLLNQGPVIKLNANQRYATNSETSAWFRLLCQKADVPVQSFIMRSDLACGSTIGPITASELGVRTLDVGVPQFAMHSIREMAGARDAFYLQSALRSFLLQEKLES
ncbi:M18 family aminopeptidase [Oceanospirillum sediminis]|uniref:M18 family aminopeptidase n=1 Tax=Oceanospirillum sediminis TaxID=2760088 RepID=A0A839IKR9_9GAMM|nr:M18 family aminopeptidase [Oceanospirillum sediminis]MBB1485538.1 M18 family aminopeptidase [Oceanospirillum sediminis]